MSPLSLSELLRGKALELASESLGGTFLTVAEEQDAARLNQPRGTVLTVAELRLVLKIEDSRAAAEVLLIKRFFDGSLSDEDGPGK